MLIISTICDNQTRQYAAGKYRFIIKNRQQSRFYSHTQDCHTAAYCPVSRICALLLMNAQVTPACSVDTLASSDASGPGAFISGIDINTLEDTDVAVIREALGNYGVVFFREQNVSPDGHIQFAQHFGAININRFFQPVSEYPQIAEVSKEPDQSKNIG